MKLLIGLHLLLLQTAVLAYCDDCGPDTVEDEAWDLSPDRYPYRTFYSTDLISPVIHYMNDSVNDTTACYDGLHTFLTPRGFAVPDPLAAIFDDQGDLVWAKKTQGQAYDLKPQEFNGEQYLSYWSGDDGVRGHGSGEWILLDNTYTERYRIKAMNGLHADLHELIITPEGTALITIYEVIEKNVTGFTAGEEAPSSMFLWDCLVQEVDFVNDTLLFQWRASDHYNITDSFHDVGNTGFSSDDPYDFFHINSVQKDELGNYLVSARYTFSATYIDGRSGDIIWIVGGKRNSFKDLSSGNATDFAWQHDARLHDSKAFPFYMTAPSTRRSITRSQRGSTTKYLTIFDNAAEDIIHTREYSRGLLVELTYPNPQSGARSIWPFAGVDRPQQYTARLIQSYRHPGEALSSSQGSMQLLPPAPLADPQSLAVSPVPNASYSTSEPRFLLSYGYSPVLTTYALDGTVLCDARFAPAHTWQSGNVQSYRAHKAKWVGRPVTIPNTAVDLGTQTVYASWNGATEVKRWRLETVHRLPGGTYDEDDAAIGETVTEEGIPIPVDDSETCEVQSACEWTEVLTSDKMGFETKLGFEGRVVWRYLRVVALDAEGKVLGTSEVADLRAMATTLLNVTLACKLLLSQFEQLVIAHRKSLVCIGCIALLSALGLRLCSRRRRRGSISLWRRRLEDREGSLEKLLD